MRRVNFTNLLIALGITTIAAAALLSFHNNKSPATPSSPMEQAQRPPSTIEPQVDDLASYTVPSDQPRFIFIDKFNIKARVRALGTTKNNAITAPSNVFDAGWFNESSKPGQNGSMLIDGHISSDSTKGVFYHLKDLKIGDRIAVETGDGRQFNYSVVTSKTYDYDKVDMLEVLKPVDIDSPGLNLISCDGSVIKGTHSFNKRTVVFAKQV